jgi:hypothetical protein
LERNEAAEAARLLTEATATARDLDSPYLLVNLLPTFAALAARAGLDEDAPRLLGAGRSLEQTSGLDAETSPASLQAVDDARDRLGEARFAELLAEGARLPSDDAVALAMAVAQRVGSYSSTG